MNQHRHSPPPALVHALLEGLAAAGECIVVARAGAVSVNLPGRFYIGPDGADPYAVRMRGCACHLHLDWSRIVSFDAAAEDVGYGPEPCVSLLGPDGQALLKLYYPPESGAAVEAALRKVALERQP